MGHENVRGMDIATPNNPRSNLFPAIVTMAAMAVAAVAGYWFMPRADIALPLVEGCRLDREACTAGLPDGGAVMWVGFVGGEVVKVPDRTAQVDLIEGPGWDVGADGDAAQAWCVAEVGRVLGGTPIADGG